jgi:hypothetical protein
LQELAIRPLDWARSGELGRGRAAALSGRRIRPISGELGYEVHLNLDAAPGRLFVASPFVPPLRSALSMTISDRLARR